MSALQVDPDAAGTCECGVGLIRQRAWAKASTAQRRTWLENDQRMLQGRGLCRGCYLKAYKDGAFPVRMAIAAPHPKPRPCTRCGIENAGPLCRDCVAVMDRDELALWSA